MKKIGIVTVYYTENIGSILQATALQQILKSLDCEVYFVSTHNKYSAHSKINLLKSVLRAIKYKLNIMHCFERYFYYEKYIERTFKVLEADYVKASGIECIVIGSDTVWDVNSDYFLESSEIFWGMKWDDSIPIITYAASISNSSYDKIDSLKYPIVALEKIKEIGVRDNYTKKYVEHTGNFKVTLNCDPTLLLDVEFYKKECFDIYRNYILLYLFEDLTDDFREKLNLFAKERRLKIICIGKYIKGCHKWETSTIKNFLSYFNSARYIITNTFHGTIFSIIFNKQFIALDYNKVKVNELLDEFELKSRLTVDNIDILVNEKIDYEIVNQKLEAMRIDSKLYLYRAIKT